MTYSKQLNYYVCPLGKAKKSLLFELESKGVKPLLSDKVKSSEKITSFKQRCIQNPVRYL